MTDMTAEQALEAVRNVLRRAYNSANPVCCGLVGNECCGSPEPEWSEYDQQIINDLQPVEEYLRQALTAQPAAATTAPSDETLRLADVIADKIEDGTLFQAGIFSRRDLADKIRAVVRFARQGVPPAALTAPRVPDGWKLVPRHPDGAMGEAAYDAEMKALHHGEPASFIDVWQAMYDAAPMLTAAQSPADATLIDEGNMGQVSDSDEIAKPRERVKELESYFHKMIGVPASVGVCEPIEGYVERPGDAVDAMREMADRLREGGDQ